MIPFMQFIDSQAASMVETVWKSAALGTALLLLAAVVARSAAFLSPKAASWILRLAGLKVLLLVIGLPSIAIPVLQRIEQTAFSPAPSAPDPKAVMDANPGPMDPAVASVSPELAEHASFSLPRFAARIWLIGVLLSALWIIKGYWSSVRIRRSAVLTTSHRLIGMLDDECRRMGVKARPALGLSKHLDRPALIGAWRPMVVLQSDAESRFDSDELRLILAHELGHLRRRDLIWSWLPALLQAIYFWNPAVWLFVRQWAETQEAACDELVLHRTDARASEYGRLLLKVSTGNLSGISMGYAGAEVIGSYRTLERRIQSLGRIQPFAGRTTTGFAASLAALAVVGLLPWKLVPASNRAVAADDPPAAEKKDPDRTPDGGSRMLKELRAKLEPIAESLAKKDGYRLEEGQFVKRIAPPFSVRRSEYVHSWMNNGLAATTIWFRWEDGRLTGDGASFSYSVEKGEQVSSLLTHLIDVMQLVEGDADLLKATVSGDWVVDKRASKEARLSDLDDILAKEAGLPIRMQFRKVSRQVYVAKGDYKLNPIPGGRGDKSEAFLTDETRTVDPIEIFGKEMVPTGNGGGGMGDFNEFLDWTARWIHRPILSEVTTGPSRQLGWMLHMHDPITAESDREDHDPELVLANITRQTGLTFTLETREVDVLFVERTK